MGSGMTGILRAAIAGVVCVQLVVQPLGLEALGHKHMAGMTQAPASTQLQGDERILHALNRMSYGPRPGDVEAVRQMGLDKWFELQLHPEKIDNSALEARLAQYPALKLSEERLAEKFPTGPMIRAMYNGLQPLPTDSAERAIYTDVTYFYGESQKHRVPAPKDGDGNGMMPAQDDSEDGPGARGQVQALLALAPTERLQRILDTPPQQLLAMRKQMGVHRQQIVEGMTPEQRETLESLVNPRSVVVNDLLAATLVREIYSETQVQEVMTDFWLNHFNIYIKKNENTPYQLTAYERDVIAPHALGRFEDLLVATAKSTAMMSYLDNWESIGPDSMAARNGGAGRYAQAMAERAKTPEAKAQVQAIVARAPKGLNENYARELMELHTLGVNGGYTQKDVTEVAKVFTGWTIERPMKGGGFLFDERRHEPGTKLVLGKTIAEHGQTEGYEVLHMLATSPQTAKSICRKLAVRFVSDTPPQALVDRMAQSFLDSKGDMREVLRTMWSSPEFWGKDAYRAKVKTPLEYVVSAARAGQVDVKTPLPLVATLERLGMPLYGCMPPTGYYWRASDWVSTSALVTRMNFALALGANAIPGVTTDWAVLLREGSGEAASQQQKEQQLEALILDRPASDKTRAAVMQQAQTMTVAQAASRFQISPDTVPGMDNGGTAGKGQKREQRALQQIRPNAPPTDPQASVMAGLLIGSPDFQRR